MFEWEIVYIFYHYRQTLSIEFLHGRKTPTIAVLYTDRANARHVKTHTVSVKDREFLGGPWFQDNVDSQANFLIPVPEPFCGAVIVGSESLLFVNGESNICVAPSLMRGAVVQCYCQVDSTRYLLGDSFGRLFMLFLVVKNESAISDIKVEYLGLTNIAESLTYLDNSVVYVGSRFGDSQLVRLNTEADSSGSFVQALDNYTNVGPILDMCVMDVDRQGQTQLVTCSGAFSNGSLRIIRSGVGIHEHASIDLPDTKQSWAISWKPDSSHTVIDQNDQEMNNVVVLSFIGQTRFLLLATDNDPEEIEVPGLTCSEQTLYCGNVAYGQILQITASGITLLSQNTSKQPVKWSPPDSRQIGVCSCNGDQVVCASGDQIYYLDIDDGSLSGVAEGRLDCEIACIGIGPRDVNARKASFCVVGLWKEISVRLLTLPSFDLMHKELLGTEIIPRSVLLVNFDGTCYLLVSMGDGTLFYFHFVNGSANPLCDRKKLILGTQPMTLRAFSYQGVQNVFAISDRATVIYSRNQKLVLSSVNMKNVVSVCSLNSAAYPDSVVIATSNAITFGSILDIQRLHVQTVALREAPRRLAYDELTNTIAVATVRLDYPGISLPAAASTIAPSQSGYKGSAGQASEKMDEDKPKEAQSASAGTATETSALEEHEMHSLLIFDASTFELLHARHFAPNEYVCSVAAVKFESEPTVSYFTVGFANIVPGEMEPRSGKLQVFSWNSSSLVQVAEKDLKGAPYCLLPFNGRLVATVNSSVMLFSWTANKELQQDCAYYNCIQALYAKTMNDNILVGDLMHSMILLTYKPVECQLEEISRDLSPAWMTAVEFLDEDKFIGGENGCNLMVCARACSDVATATANSGNSGNNNNNANTTGTVGTDDEHKPMTNSGKIYVGDFVNVMQRGWLGIQHVVDAIAVKVQTPVLFGTVAGSIGVAIPLPSEMFELLKKIEGPMGQVVKGIGRIPHEDYRAFQNERQTTTASGFVDGDLLELFVDLPIEKQHEVIKGITVDDGSGMKRETTVEEVSKLLEELSHLH